MQTFWGPFKNFSKELEKLGLSSTGTLGLALGNNFRLTLHAQEFITKRNKNIGVLNRTFET